MKPLSVEVALKVMEANFTSPMPAVGSPACRALLDLMERLQAGEGLAGNPPRTGRYLALAYEWAGCEKDKPARPEWDIRVFERIEEVKWVPVKPAHPFENPPPRREVVVTERWRKREYRYDTGGMENLIVLEWRALPPVPA